MGLGHRAGVRIRPGHRHFTTATKAPSEGAQLSHQQTCRPLFSTYDHCNEQQQGSEDTGADPKPEGWAASQEAAPSDQVTKYWVWTPPTQVTKLACFNKTGFMPQAHRGSTEQLPSHTAEAAACIPVSRAESRPAGGTGERGSPRNLGLSRSQSPMYFRAPRTS